MSEDSPSNRQIFFYSFIALPLAFAGLPLYVHAPDFYTRELGMNIGLIGIILLGIRLFDAIQDPMIGYISDKNASARYKIIFAGVLMLILGMGAIFYGPPDSFSVPVWFALSMILATTGFSIITINLNMIGGFWHDKPDQRTRISAWREAFALTGLLIASVLPAALQALKPAEDAFKLVFYFFTFIMIAGFILFSRFMGRISPGHLINKNSTHSGLSFFSILLSKDRMFFMVCFLTHLAAAMPGVMVLFFIRDYLGADHLAGLFLFLYFIAGAAFMPLWVRLAKVIGKERSWSISMFLSILTFMWAFLLEPGHFIAYGIICVLSGSALGADLALPPSILADRVNVRRREAEATQYYALLAFIPKCAIAIASGIAFLTLDYIGFKAGADNSSEVMHGVSVLYALVPCLIKFVAAYLLMRMLKNEGDYYEQFKKDHSHGAYDVS